MTSGPCLQEVQRLPTSGARAAVPFELDGQLYLAIPQLAQDIAGDPPDMNGGTSDLDSLIYRWEPSREPAGATAGGGAFAEYQRIPSHGGESIAFFSLDGRSFLAMAQIRSGTRPDFDYRPASMLYAWDGSRFVPVQGFPTFAAKHVHAFRIGRRHFLAFAEALAPPGAPEADTCSHIYSWNGRAFEPFQALPSKWGYGFTHFRCDGHDFLALADHARASVLYRWTDESFQPFQSFAEAGGGRHFRAFEADGRSYLAFANLTGGSGLYEWQGGRFALTQSLEGKGARNFQALSHGGARYLFRTNYITGTPTAPTAALDSQLYRFEGGRLALAATYPTSGGTEAAPFLVDRTAYLAVANSLSADIRFRTDTVIYRFEYR